MEINWPWARKDKVMSASDLYKELLERASSKSGIAVNRKTAMQASTAIACARVIAEGIAQVPFKVFKERVGGGMDAARDHSLYDVLANKPNEWQTSFEFREMIGFHLAFARNAYAYKVRSLRGEVVELLPFEPNMVQLVRNQDSSGWGHHYQVTTFNGQRLMVPREDMWHLRGLSWDGYSGLDGITLAKEAIALSLATEEHSSRLFKNGAQPGGFLVSDAVLKEDQVKLLRETWEASQGGVQHAYKTAILFGGLKYQSGTMTGVDAQHLEQRRFQVEDVCRHFRVMPIMVGHSDKSATYASAEQMFLAHVVHTMMPHYARIESSADVNLITKADRVGGYYTKFMASALMRGASKDRAEYFAKALGAGGAPGWMTQDEVRALEEMNPMGGDAAKLPIATNVPKPQGANDATAD